MTGTKQVDLSLIFDLRLAVDYDLEPRDNLTERLSLEDETVYLVTTGSADEVDEIRLGQVDSRKCWANARRLCPDLLDALDALRSQWDADAEMSGERVLMEAEYRTNKGF